MPRPFWPLVLVVVTCAPAVLVLAGPQDNTVHHYLPGGLQMPELDAYDEDRYAEEQGWDLDDEDLGSWDDLDGEEDPSADRLAPPDAGSASFPSGAPVPSSVEAIAEARRRRADLDTLLARWVDAIEAHRSLRGAYPEGLAGLSLPTPPEPGALPRVAVRVPTGSIDPWGQPLVYERIADDRAFLTSAGPDTVLGTEDDVRESLPRIVIEDR